MSVNRYARIREDHSREVAEDYCELIQALILETGEARVVDLATRLGVSNVTVTKTVQRLVRDGFLESKPYRSVFLTDGGRQLAEMAQNRHQMVLAFLRAIGVEDEVAEADAEGIEHHVSDATLEAMRRFVSDSSRR